MKINIGRIITSPQVFDRYFLTGQISPSSFKQIKKGTIFWIIEITAKNQEKIANIILNRFKKYYQQKEDGLWGFEAVLKKINRRLAKETQRKNTGWVNHLHAVLGLIQENSLHLAPSGEVSAYLFREGKISNILEVQESPPPMQTFISVISGEIQPKDKVFLGSSEFTSHITIESLASFLGLSTEKAISEIANSLRERQIKNVNALVIDCSKKNLKVDTIYLDQAPENKLTTFLRNFNFYKAKVLKTIDSLAYSLGKFELKYFKKFMEKRQKKEERQNASKEETISPVLQIEGSEKTHSVISRQKRIFSFFKNYRKIIYIISAVLIFLTFLFLIKWQLNNSHNKEIVKKLDQAKVLVEEAKIKKTTSQLKEALEKFIAAQTLIAEAKDYSKTAQEAENLDKIITQEINDLTNTTQISSLTPALIDFNVQGEVETAKIFHFNNALITFNKKGNQFFKVNLGAPAKIETLFYLPQAIGNPSDAALSEEINSFFIKNNQEQYFVYNLEDKELSEAEKSGTFNWPQNTKEILSYLERIYFLTSDGLMRSGLTASGFSIPDLAASTSDNNQIKSVAIDGSIYFLIGGEVKKYIMGKEQSDFFLNVPFYLDLSDAQKIFTQQNLDTLFIYLKNKQTIALFDKNGSYLQQLSLPKNWGEIQNFIATQDNNLYILAQNKVYVLKYE